MNEDLYVRLREHVDRMPIALPESGKGYEIDILRKLYTPEDAEIVLALSALPEKVDRIHRRLPHLGMSKDELEKKLDDMVRRGLIMGGALLDKKLKGKKLYSKAQMAIGFFEFQVNRLTRDVVAPFDRYNKSTFYREMNRSDGLSQMRTIPIERSVTGESAVLPYEDIRSILGKAPEPVSIMNCVCRQEGALMGKPCGKTGAEETCMTFGNAAVYFMENGHGRRISKDEARALLDSFEEKGLILQPENARSPGFLCACCGCCCGVLTGLKQFEKPAEYFNSSYFAKVDRENCSGCGTCVTRCNMEAVEVVDKKARVDLDRCIGCGLCVSTCQTGSMSLVRKGKTFTPPKDTDQLYMKIMAKRYGIGNTLVSVGKYLFGAKV